MYEILDAPVPTSGKCYNIRGIYIGCFLGSPLLAGYFMAHNYRLLGRPALRGRTWLYALLSTVVLLSIPMILPADIRIPNFLITLTTAIGVRAFAEHRQGPLLRAHVLEGGTCYSNWRALGIGLAVTAFFVGVLTLVNVYNTPSPGFEF